MGRSPPFGRSIDGSRTTLLGAEIVVSSRTGEVCSHFLALGELLSNCHANWVLARPVEVDDEKTTLDHRHWLLP
jgi:hypothetical protein